MASQTEFLRHKEHEFQKHLCQKCINGCKSKCPTSYRKCCGPLGKVPKLSLHRKREKSIKGKNSWKCIIL